MAWWQNVRESLRKGKQGSANPQENVDALLRELGEQVTETETALANQTATASDLRRRAEDARDLAGKRKAQVIAALDAGQTDLARKALAEQTEYERRAEEALKLATDAEDVSRGLRNHVEELRLEQLNLQAKRDALVARGDVAGLDRQLADIKSGLDARARSFEALSDQTVRLEAEAAAHRAVADETFDGGQPTASGDASQADLDEKLKALQRQLGGGA